MTTTSDLRREYEASVVFFQQEIEKERLARELHETMQIDDLTLKQALEDSDKAEVWMKSCFYRLKLIA